MDEKDFEWLTEEICREYMGRAEKLSQNDHGDTGALRALRIELQERCNITETQAYNILRGLHVKDYLLYYGIKSGRVPMPEAMQARIEKERKKKTAAEKLKEYEARIEELESLQRGVFAGGSEYGFEEKD